MLSTVDSTCSRASCSACGTSRGGRATDTVGAPPNPDTTRAPNRSSQLRNNAHTKGSGASAAHPTIAGTSAHRHCAARAQGPTGRCAQRVRPRADPLRPAARPPPYSPRHPCRTRSPRAPARSRTAAPGRAARARCTPGRRPARCPATRRPPPDSTSTATAGADTRRSPPRARHQAGPRRPHSSLRADKGHPASR